jgi:hypothetical protein
MSLVFAGNLNSLEQCTDDLAGRRADPAQLCAGIFRHAHYVLRRQHRTCAVHHRRDPVRFGLCLFAEDGEFGDALPERSIGTGNHAVFDGLI